VDFLSAIDDNADACQVQAAVKGSERNSAPFKVLRWGKTDELFGAGLADIQSSRSKAPYSAKLL